MCLSNESLLPFDNNSMTSFPKDVSQLIKIVKAIKLYKKETPMLIRKCMLKAGFETIDLAECGQLYSYCLGRALEYEFQRLELLKQSLEVKQTNTSTELIDTTNCSKLDTIKKALVRYRFESCYTIVKCMLKAGFESSETDVYHPIYQACLEQALLTELNRWRYLRSTFRRAKRRKIIEGGDLKLCSAMHSHVSTKAV